MIYLSGGNTFTMLKALRYANVDTYILNEYYNGEQVTLAGLSAGAILMSHDIIMAKVPKHCADKNTAKLHDLTSLGIVEDWVSPHYIDRHDRELKDFSYGCDDKVLAIKDDQAVMIDVSEEIVDYDFTGDELTFFKDGRKYKIYR
jgi:peptidase E